MARVRGRMTLAFRDHTGKPVWSAAFANGVATEGLDRLLNAMFRGTATANPWKAGLISSASFVGVAATDTHASHPGWVEFTGYSGGVRPGWSPGAAGGGVLVNGTPVAFAVTSSGNLRGAFLASGAVQDTSSGEVLYATAINDADLPVTAGGTLSLTYQVTITPGS